MTSLFYVTTFLVKGFITLTAISCTGVIFHFNKILPYLNLSKIFPVADKMGGVMAYSFRHDHIPEILTILCGTVQILSR